MQPVFDGRVITHLNQVGLSIDFIQPICLKFNNLNRFISDDPSLGPGFQIGHSYFIINKTPSDAGDWFDNDERLAEAKSILGLDKHD